MLLLLSISKVMANGQSMAIINIIIGMYQYNNDNNT